MSVDLSEYYANLLIVQYNQKFNASEEIKLGAKTFSGDWLLTDIPEMTDVDVAKGAQLGLIGKIVGVPRNADGFTYGIPFFSFNDYDNPMSDPKGRGFSDIGATNEAPFKDYDQVYSSLYEMVDTNYRAMVLLKILSNNSSSSLKDVDEGLYRIFGDGISIVDNFDMTVTITIKSSEGLNGRLADFLNLFTRPLGVGLNIVYE